MNFFEELKKGHFVIAECTKCHQIVWPPNDFCRFCFGDVSWRDIKEAGILVECSAKDGKRFGIVEFEGMIRIIGTISDDTEMKPGGKMRVDQCSYDSSPRFTFSAA